MEGPLSTEKILPRTLEVATILITTYFVLTFMCAFSTGYLVCQFLIV